MPQYRRIAAQLTLLSALLLGACGAKTDRLAVLQRDLASGEAKKVAAAAIKLKSMVQEQPKEAAPRLLLGQHLLASGDPAAAAIELRRALELGQPADAVLPVLARAMLRDGKAAQVVAQFRNERLADAVSQADLMASVATALAVQGDLSQANQLLTSTLQAAPEATSLLLTQSRLRGTQGQVTEALAGVDAVLQRQPHLGEAWALKAEVHSRTPGGMAAAREAYANAIRHDATDTRSMAASIALSLAANDLQAARATFQQLKAFAPKQVTTGLAEANIAYASGDNARAREVFQALLRALPENVTILLGAGENELRLGSAQQAEAHFAKASALAPGNALARQLLAQAQLRLGQAAKVLVTLEPLINAPGASPQVLAIAAEALQVNGEQKAAEAMYARIAKLNPTDPKLRTAIALAKVDKAGDAQVADELRAIGQSDKGTWADLALVNLLVRRNQPEQALAALSAVERKRPDDAFTHHLRGQLLVSLGRPAEARASFDKALSLNAGYAPATAALAALDMREGHGDAARKRFSDTIRAQPTNVTAMLGHAEILAKQGAASEKITAQIDAAIKAAPQNVLARTALIVHYFDRSQFDAALNAARAATSAMPENLELLELLARCQLRLQQTSQALNTYGKIANLAPRSPRAHIGMAETQLKTNDLAGAERSIRRALELSPGLLEARAQAIVLAMKRQQFAQAIDIARKIQAEQPTQALGFTLEGEVEARRGQWAAAVAALQTATRKQAPGAAPMKLYQAMVKNSQQADADRLAARWMQQHPKDAAFLFIVAEAADAGGDAAKAERVYRQVLELQPNQAVALNNLAMLLARQKRPEALALAEQAVRNAPGQAVLLDTLAYAQAANGNLSDAVESQRKAVALAPEDRQFRLALAKLLLQAKKPALAKAELTKLINGQADASDMTEVRSLLASLR